jgi:hypothetical protein
VLRGGLENTLMKAKGISRDSLDGIFIGTGKETIGEVRESLGINVAYRKGEEAAKKEDDSNILTTPMYDPDTKKIYIPQGDVKDLTNKLGHELGHAEIDEWGYLDHRDADWGRSSTLGMIIFQHPKEKSFLR